MVATDQGDHKRATEAAIAADPKTTPRWAVPKNRSFTGEESGHYAGNSRGICCFRTCRTGCRGCRNPMSIPAACKGEANRFFGSVWNRVRVPASWTSKGLPVVHGQQRDAPELPTSAFEVGGPMNQDKTARDTVQSVRSPAHATTSGRVLLARVVVCQSSEDQSSGIPENLPAPG